MKHPHYKTILRPRTHVGRSWVPDESNFQSPQWPPGPMTMSNDGFGGRLIDRTNRVLRLAIPLNHIVPARSSKVQRVRSQRQPTHMESRQ